MFRALVVCMGLFGGCSWIHECKGIGWPYFEVEEHVCVVWSGGDDYRRV